MTYVDLAPDDYRPVQVELDDGVCATATSRRTARSRACGRTWWGTHQAGRVGHLVEFEVVQSRGSGRWQSEARKSGTGPRAVALTRSAQPLQLNVVVATSSTCVMENVAVRIEAGIGTSSPSAV
jgi:hypothetical protein